LFKGIEQEERVKELSKKKKKNTQKEKKRRRKESWGAGFSTSVGTTRESLKKRKK